MLPLVALADFSASAPLPSSLGAAVLGAQAAPVKLPVPFTSPLDGSGDATSGVAGCPLGSDEFSVWVWILRWSRV